MSVALALTLTPLPTHRPLRQGVSAAGWEENEQEEDRCEEGRPKPCVQRSHDLLSAGHCAPGEGGTHRGWGGHHHGSGAAPSPPSSLLRAPVGGDGDAYVECPVVTSSMGAAGAQALLPVVFAGDGRESPNPLRACHTSAVRGGFCRKG